MGLIQYTGCNTKLTSKSIEKLQLYESSGAAAALRFLADTVEASEATIRDFDNALNNESSEEDRDFICPIIDWFYTKGGGEATKITNFDVDGLKTCGML